MQVPQSPHGVELHLYQTRPDLWALSCALRHASQYRQAIWNLLSDEDKESLRAYKTLYQTAQDAYKAANKPAKEKALIYLTKQK